MRKLMFLSVLAAGLASPAFAAWQDYQVPEMAFFVTFPSEPKVEDATYTAPGGVAMKGKRYWLEQDNNIYQILVVDFAGNTIKKADIVKEAVDRFRAQGKVHEDIYARIGSEFGRNLNIKLDKGGSNYLSIYFTVPRRLYIIEGIKTPASKNAYALRFKESISFINPPGAGRGGRGGAVGGAAPAGRGAPEGAAPAGRGAAPPQ